MIRIWALFFGITVGGFLYGQSAIDYQPKKLMKELERKWGFTDPCMEEMELFSLNKDHPSLQGVFYHVWNENQPDIARYVYIGRVNSCRAGGCAIAPSDGFFPDSEYFDYFILFDPELSVQSIRVYNYQATHGQEVAAKGWLKQFNGYGGEKELLVGKDIDAISGATVSVYAITEDVVQKTSILRQVASDRFPAKAEK